MRIAVTYEEGQVFQHFGRALQCKIYDTRAGKVKSTMVLDTGGRVHGALAGLLKSNHVDAVICGGIGPGAKRALATAGILFYGGVTGDADKAVEALLASRLAFASDVECGHHGEGDPADAQAPRVACHVVDDQHQNG